MEKYNLSELERNFSFNEKDIVSSAGTLANVYKTIEPEKVAKIMKERFSESSSIDVLFDKESIQENDKLERKIMRKLGNELYMGEKAKEYGINVPELYGVSLLNEKNSGKEFPGLVTEYLDGVGVDKITKDGKNKNIEGKWRYQIDKASKYFEERDFTDKVNAIYVPKKDDVYLVDFMDWKFKK